MKIDMKELAERAAEIAREIESIKISEIPAYLKVLRAEEAEATGELKALLKNVGDALDVVYEKKSQEALESLVEALMNGSSPSVVGLRSYVDRNRDKSFSGGFAVKLPPLKNKLKK